METILLIKYGELHLKGLNRPYFESKLINGIKNALNDMEAQVRREQGRIFVTGLQESSVDDAVTRLKRVFGIHAICVAAAVDKQWEAIVEAAVSMAKNAAIGDKRTFKVFAKRSDKRFELDSLQICRELGKQILDNTELTVDVNDPQIRLTVEIRDKAYMYLNEIRCAGGLPTGTAGRAALLISGGIDSPVAGYVMARRGLELSAVHFYSFPYTSERALEKVIALTGLVAAYSGEIRLHLVPFTDIQMAIYDKCPEKETTIIMRRLMMQIAETIAREDHCEALITGESLGQVASQTLKGLCATDDAVAMPVFRPLIGTDKDEIVSIAKSIGTFETSILPYEDCCTIFVPKHPVTKPDVEAIRKSQARVDFDDMIKVALETRRIEQVGRS